MIGIKMNAKEHKIQITFSSHALQSIAGNTRASTMLQALDELLLTATPTGLAVLHIADKAKSDRNRIYVGIARLIEAELVTKVRNSVYLLNPEHIHHPLFTTDAAANWQAMKA